MEDSLYPNDGQAFDDFNSIPKEQDAEEREQQSKFEKSYPVIKDWIEELKQEIANTDSMSKMGINESTPEFQVKVIMYGTAKYRALLQTKLDSLQTQEDAFKGQ